MEKLWTVATSLKSLQVGWHLTRRELRSDFFFDIYHQQAFALNLDSQIKELSRALGAGTFYPRPLRSVPVPKGLLATRPGSHIALRDRIVLWSIVKTIAPYFEKAMQESVYSYRLKENPKKGELFKEGDALAIPFLKGRDISLELDPFEAWYELWPDFEERTKDEIGSGYRFMAVTDIAGYFENINLELLRDQ